MPMRTPLDTLPGDFSLWHACLRARRSKAARAARDLAALRVIVARSIRDREAEPFAYCCTQYKVRGIVCQRCPNHRLIAEPRI